MDENNVKPPMMAADNPQDGVQEPLPPLPPQQPTSHSKPRNNGGGKSMVMSGIALAVSVLALGVSIASIAMPDTQPAAPQASQSQTTNKADSGKTGDTGSVDAQQSEQPATNNTPGEGDTGGWHVKVTNTEAADDGNGGKLLVVTMDVTNNTGDDDRPYSNIEVAGYQNGVQLKENSSILWDTPLHDQYMADINARGTNIRDGVTFTMRDYLSLNDPTSPVELEITAVGGKTPVKLTVNL